VLIFLGVIRSPLAGDLLTAQCSELMESWNVDVVPAYMVKSKVGST
jgi:Actin.